MKFFYITTADIFQLLGRSGQVDTGWKKPGGCRYL